MMSVLYKNVDWKKIKYIGFDLDGTLYDEYNFIVQPYLEISDLFVDKDNAFKFMSNRWLKKGSSYSFIFDEAYGKFELAIRTDKNNFIDAALAIFRSFSPKIKLSKRTESILYFVKKEYKIFLVTDGNYKLQKNKYDALSLDKYFSSEDVVFTDLHPMEYQKPGIKALELLDIEAECCLFFGDRKRDESFALSSKMQFQKVYNMIAV